MFSTLSHDSITLHYQPLAAGPGNVVGFESLMRWHHQQRGPISPEAFIPIFERCGLIVPLSQWALRQACLDASRWKSPLQVSINLSPILFHTDDLCGWVQDVIGETGLAPDRLELEVTAATLAADIPGAQAALLRLSALGVRIALDDAGEGVALPFLLQEFPVSSIKIARQVVASIETSVSARSIIYMIMLVARSLHVPVVAKGVETGGQLAYLRDQGCDLMQGFLMGRPASIETFAALTGNAVADFPASATSIPRHVESLMVRIDDAGLETSRT